MLPCFVRDGLYDLPSDIGGPLSLLACYFAGPLFDVIAGLAKIRSFCFGRQPPPRFQISVGWSVMLTAIVA